ncbi:MAG: alpha/beta hydrolase [Bacteroidetes bacterium]|nr:alpha/beta hydrolase [Bacteroidota bacterium]
MVRYFIRDGRRLAYTDTGRGDVIVLLHGYLGSLDVFKNISGKLSRSFRIVAVDLPGHGQSDILSECHSMELMAASVYDLIRFLGIDRVLITGHSLGGYVVLAFLEKYAELVGGYCLFHSHPFADSDEAIERRKREIQIVLAGRKSIMYPSNIEKMYSPYNLERFNSELNALNDIASRTPDDGIVAVLKGMIARPSRLGLMESSQSPFLWVLGIHDQYIDYRSVTGAVQLPSNGQMATLFESGHLGFIEEPERSTMILRDFALKVFGSESRA